METRIPYFSDEGVADPEHSAYLDAVDAANDAAIADALDALDATDDTASFEEAMWGWLEPRHLAIVRADANDDGPLPDR